MYEMNVIDLSGLFSHFKKIFSHSVQRASMPIGMRPTGMFVALRRLAIHFKELMNYGLLGFLLFFPISYLNAQQATALEFLRWSIDPVAVGMGETGTASPASLFSYGVNPAHINNPSGIQFFYSNRSFLTENFFGVTDLRLFVLGGTYRFEENHTMGVFFKQLDITPQDPVFDPNLEPERKQTDRSIEFAYGRQFNQQWAGALLFKLLHSDLGVATANSWAVDVGFTRLGLFPGFTFRIPSANFYPFTLFQNGEPAGGISIGLALLNAGPHIAYIDENQADPIPQRLRLGIAYQVIASPIITLLGKFDFEKELVRYNGAQADAFYKAWFTAWKDQPFRKAIYHVGVELQLFTVFSLRYGYRHAPFRMEQDKNIQTLGFGINLRYVSLQFGKWLNADNQSALYRDSYVLGIRVGGVIF